MAGVADNTVHHFHALANLGRLVSRRVYRQVFKLVGPFYISEGADRGVLYNGAAFNNGAMAYCPVTPPDAAETLLGNVLQFFD